MYSTLGALGEGMETGLVTVARQDPNDGGDIARITNAGGWFDTYNIVGPLARMIRAAEGQRGYVTAEFDRSVNGEGDPFHVVAVNWQPVGAALAPALQNVVNEIRETPAYQQPEVAQSIIEHYLPLLDKTPEQQGFRSDVKPEPQVWYEQQPTDGDRPGGVITDTHVVSSSPVLREAAAVPIAVGSGAAAASVLSPSVSLVPSVAQPTATTERGRISNTGVILVALGALAFLFFPHKRRR